MPPKLAAQAPRVRNPRGACRGQAPAARTRARVAHARRARQLASAWLRHVMGGGANEWGGLYSVCTIVCAAILGGVGGGGVWRVSRVSPRGGRRGGRGVGGRGWWSGVAPLHRHARAGALARRVRGGEPHRGEGCKGGGGYSGRGAAKGRMPWRPDHPDPTPPHPPPLAPPVPRPHRRAQWRGRGVACILRRSVSGVGVSFLLRLCAGEQCIGAPPRRGWSRAPTPQRPRAGRQLPRAPARGGW